MEFKDFANLVEHQFKKMTKNNTTLYRVETDKNTLWDLYLKSYPEGSNPIYKTRTEFDCNCCKQFIRDVGNVVSLKNNQLETVWDIELDDEIYSVVAKSLSEFIKQQKISTVFTHYTSKVGTLVRRVNTEDKGVITWNHFHGEVPGQFINTAPGSFLSEVNSRVKVIERGLNEITDDSIEIVIDLISQNGLYRGEEHLSKVKEFKKIKDKYLKIKNPLHKNYFIWENQNNFSARIKNEVIGTLLMDLSEGKEIDEAVRLFESKVAPTNYKRPTAVVTKRMVEDAMKTIRDLGIEPSLKRRMARAEDISINNVIFSDKATSVLMKDSLEHILLQNTKSSNKDYSKVDEISIEDFIKDIVPKISQMEVLFENKFIKNLMTIVAPEDATAPNILKWDNNFSWSYNGDITDSIKEKVKKAGGNVSGVLRASLSWFNYDDLDIHLIEPEGGREINFQNKGLLSPLGGKLDVDMNVGHGSSREAVENIFYTNAPKKVGWYKVFVHNYSKRETTNEGFVVQIEYNGNIKDYAYNRSVKNHERVNVVDLHWDGTTVSEIKIHSNIEENGVSKEIWGIKTEDWTKVNILTLSPNHWDENSVGNKHYFFILDKCVNPDSTRGVYNEFIKGEFDKHRKVFELIGNKLKCEYSDKQLSGLGFSTTQRESILCKVSGNFNRTLKVKF